MFKNMLCEYVEDDSVMTWCVANHQSSGPTSTRILPPPPPPPPYLSKDFDLKQTGKFDPSSE